MQLPVEFLSDLLGVYYIPGKLFVCFDISWLMYISCFLRWYFRDPGLINLSVKLAPGISGWVSPLLGTCGMGRFCIHWANPSLGLKWFWAKAVVSIYLKKELEKKASFFLPWCCCSACFLSVLAGCDWAGFDNVRLWQHKCPVFCWRCCSRLARVWEWCQSGLKAELLMFGAVALAMVSLIWEHTKTSVFLLLLWLLL